jgi:organic hydroperoxide reductase OsmC/OhrA
MAEHHASLAWKRETRDFLYETYDRSHQIRFGGGISIRASSAPEFRGKAAEVNPEEQFVAALSSCHMLTFLALAAKKRMVVDQYEDAAVGFLEKGPHGRLCMTRVILRPKVRFAEPVPSAEALADLHARAHHECFIASSVTTDVRVEIPNN